MPLQLLVYLALYVHVQSVIGIASVELEICEACDLCVCVCDLCVCVCVCVCRSLAVGSQFSSWEAMLKDTEEEAKVHVHDVHDYLYIYVHVHMYVGWIAAPVVHV